MKAFLWIVGLLLCLPVLASEPKADRNNSNLLPQLGQQHPLELMVLGPPLIADPRVPDWEGATEWASLANQLEVAREMGVTTVSVDVWWGLVHLKEGGTPDCFDWAYYDRLFKLIVEKGLKIAPILSAHTYGRNVNDHGAAIGLPPFITQKMKEKGWGYKSELGNWNYEAISPWGVPGALKHLSEYWAAFRDHFAPVSEHFSKVIVGMGPAGELVYPSYHSHDRAKPIPGRVSEAEFPGRGVLQHCSPAAVADLQAWLRKKYGTVQNLNTAWGSKYQSFEEVVVLSNVEEVDRFFSNHDQYSPMGQDFFDWLHGSLMRAGRRLGETAGTILHQDGKGMEKVRLAAKVGGVHWQFHDRIPLLTAGLTTTRGARKEGETPSRSWHPADWSVEEGAGLDQIFTEVLKPLRDKAIKNNKGEWVGIFTCAEMQSCDYHCLDTQSPLFGRCATCRHANFPGAQARSGAEQLLQAVMNRGQKYSVPIFVENALEGNVHSDTALNRMVEHVDNHKHIFGVTLLRLGSVVQSAAARKFYEQLGGRTDRQLPCSARILMIGPDEVAK